MKNKLHLGAGNENKSGWINHDLVKLQGIDITHDLIKVVRATVNS